MVYELEGLLELALRRGGDMPANLAALVADKSFMIANRAAEWKVDSAELGEVEVTTYVAETPSVRVKEIYDVPEEPVAQPSQDDAEEKEVEIFVNEVLPASEPEQEEPLDHATPDEDAAEEMPEEELEKESAEEEYEEELEVEAAEEEAEEEPAGEETSEEEEPIEEAEAYKDEEIAEEVEDTEEAEEAEQEAASPAVEPIAKHSGKPLASFFSINDKFRFRRELFSNSNAEFVDALNLIETMESVEEAEDYFFNDLQWDAQSDDVADFLTIVHRYFSSY